MISQFSLFSPYFSDLTYQFSILHSPFSIHSSQFSLPSSPFSVLSSQLQMLMSAEKYVEIIMRDEMSMIAAEQTTVYEAARIERLYKFHDGAIMRYEWQDSSIVGDRFNHRFSLVEPPTPNPAGLERGIVKVIDHPT